MPFLDILIASSLIFSISGSFVVQQKKQRIHVINIFNGADIQDFFFTEDKV